jgi:L-ascorbate metabolism protein UlaG (beta-lactamase superfamily)
MKITFLGHSGFLIETNGKSLLIDPFLTGNPVAKRKAEEVKADYIFLSHGHGDHLGDTVSIAKKNDALVVTTFELATWLGWQGVKAHGMSTGGSYAFDFGRVKLTPALHGAGFVDEEKKEIIYLGPPVGFLFTIEDKTIYFAGDTALFSDMKLIGMKRPVDLALLPIGDNFTMGPEDALIAAEWVNARRVVPMHYNTFPLIAQDAKAFVEQLKEKGIEGIILEPEESIML